MPFLLILASALASQIAAPAVWAQKTARRKYTLMVAPVGR